MTALCCGPSFAAAMPLSISSLLEPIRNSPAGTTTISGQFWHSLKASFGLSPHSSGNDNVFAVPGEREVSCGDAPEQPDEALCSWLLICCPSLGSPVTTAASRVFVSGLALAAPPLLAASGFC